MEAKNYFANSINAGCNPGEVAAAAVSPSK
jgi:hypothetical protein